eukprot:365345-Chlamydomonas_euryale.AAC.3
MPLERLVSLRGQERRQGQAPGAGHTSANLPCEDGSDKAGPPVSCLRGLEISLRGWENREQGHTSAVSGQCHRQRQFCRVSACAGGGA